MFKNIQPPYQPTGTTSPIYIPRVDDPPAVKPGENYFFVKIHGAQVAFYGSIWERVRQLLITSQVSLNHALLGPEPLRAIQRARAVQRRRAEKLGLSSNLIDLVPATMTHVSLSIDFVLDKENRLQALSGLINEDAFVTAISLAPGAAPVAKTLGSLSAKLLRTFLSAEERQPILQFNGDFNVHADDLRDGYYVILGTRDEDHPLPTSPWPELSVAHGELLMDGQPVRQLSYVILETRVLPVRTRDTSDGAPWAEKLQLAEATAQRLAGDPFASEDERKQAWETCKKQLKEGQLLLLADSNFLPREAQDIVAAAFKQCRDQIFAPEFRTLSKSTAAPEAVEIENEKRYLDLDPGEDIEQRVASYAEQAMEARRILQEP